eukprot:c43354_g1_i1 orf=40-282(-)
MLLQFLPPTHLGLKGLGTTKHFISQHSAIKKEKYSSLYPQLREEGKNEESRSPKSHIPYSISSSIKVVHIRFCKVIYNMV